MRPDRVREGRRWFDQALRDLDDARFCLGGQRFSLGCFVAQQAAEKALNAFLYVASPEDPWGHSVADLCAEAASLDEDFRALAPEAAPLDKFYIPARYPNGLPGGIPAGAFSLEDVGGAIAMADKVLALVSTKLPPAWQRK